MRIATATCLSLLGLAACASAEDDHSVVLACKLKAIPAAERPHYNDLMKRLRTAIRDRREISAGYTFTLDGKTISLRELGEWITIERLCCPFFSFQVSVSSRDEHWVLELAGPAGVKALIEKEFPVRP